jgi:hypothetical protein
VLLGADGPRIERLIGVLANRYGARQNRYIGSAKFPQDRHSWAQAPNGLPDKPPSGVHAHDPQPPESDFFSGLLECLLV